MKKRRYANWKLTRKRRGYLKKLPLFDGPYRIRFLMVEGKGGRPEFPPVGRIGVREAKRLTKKFYGEIDNHGRDLIFHMFVAEKWNSDNLKFVRAERLRLASYNAIEYLRQETGARDIRDEGCCGL